jgi:AcrR family transcriptional regulator
LARWKNSLQTSDDIQKLKRDAVLREAGRAFSKHGYHNTSLDDVAHALGISKGTLYNYVRDKQEILFAFHQLAYDLSDRAFAIGRARGGSGAEVLRTIITHYIELLTGELGACGALMEVDALRPEDRAEAAKRRDTFERAFVAIIKEGIRDGSVRTVDPKLAVFTFMGAINWLPRWFTPGGRLPGKAVAEQMADLLLFGLTTNRPAP